MASALCKKVPYSANLVIKNIDNNSSEDKIKGKDSKMVITLMNRHMLDRIVEMTAIFLKSSVFSNKGIKK